MKARLSGIFPFLILLLMAHPRPLVAQTNTNTNKSKSQQTTKESVDQLKDDFQNLKGLFKKKEKGDSTLPGPGESNAISSEMVSVPENLQLATGNNHVLALKDGVLYGWGDNSEGQLGLGNKTIEYAPRQIVPGNDWVQVTAAAMHSLGIKKDGSLWAWGWGNNHEMGLGQANSRALLPTRVGTSNEWKHVSTAMNNTVAIKKNGTLWVWGNNVSAALGVGTTPNNAVYVPTQVGRDTTWADAVAIEHIILAIKKDGSLWSWGRKGYSDVRGYAATSDVNTAPTRVGTDTDWKKVYVHRYHGNASAIGVKQNGVLWVWGNNSNGKLGLGDEDARQTPIPAKLQGPWIGFALGRFYSIAVAGDGSLWHSGNYLQWADVKAGEPNKSTRFERMKLNGKWTGVHMMQQSGVALTDTEGNIYTYGLNARGELGSGTKTGSWVPQKVELPAPVASTTNAPTAAPAATQAPLPAAQAADATKLNPVAALVFANVKSKLSNAEKKAVADLAGFVIAKSNPKQFTVKGQPANEEFPFDIIMHPVDLNNDGKEEMVLQWGNTYWCGGAGNSSMVFGKSATGTMVKIYDTQGFIFLMNNKTQGYPDLYIDVPSPTNKYPVCRWNGKEYKMVQTVTGTDALWKTLTAIEEASKKYQSGL